VWEDGGGRGIIAAMANPTTPDFGTPLIPAGGSAQSEIIHNEGLRRAEVMAARIVKAVIGEPTGSEIDGDAYIVADPATGDTFEGQENKIAFLFGGSWRFIPDLDTDGIEIPMGTRHKGWSFYVQALSAVKTWSGSAWA